MNEKIKIIMISLAFYVVGMFVTFMMWKLWFWLFDSKIWQTMFIGITLLGAMKFFWQHTEWTINKLKKS